MRALRSRNLHSDSDNNENKSEDIDAECATDEKITKKVKRAKHKRLSHENDQHLEQISEEVIKKKKSKKLKKKLTNGDGEYETDTNTKTVNTSTTENTSENDLKEVIVKKKKSKKIKKRLTKDTSTESTSENNQQEKVIKKKKSKKMKTELSNNSQYESNSKTSNISPESTSENNQEDKVVVKKKKSKRLQKSMKENENNSDTQSATTDQKVLNISTKFKQEIEDDIDKVPKKIGRQPRQFLRSTIFGSPNFDNAVTSTAMKPRRPEKIENDEFSVKACEIKSSKKERKLRNQSTVDSQIELESNRRETFILPETKLLNETADILSEIENNLKPRKKTGAIKKRLSENYSNGSRASISRRKTLPKIQIDTVIAISDSPDVSKVQEFSKSNTLGPEITSDEESGTSTLKNNSKNRESVPSRRETFSKLPKNKIFLPGVENTIITISDSPDKTRKQSTFNKSNNSVPEITSDEDSATKDSSTLKEINDSKLKTPNQSLNSTKIKNRLSTKDDSISNCRKTFCKTPKNIRESEELFAELSTKSAIKIETELLSDIGDNILEGIDTSEKTRRTRSTFNLSNTINKTGTIIVNTSGDWEIEKKETANNESKLNSTYDIQNKENKRRSSTTTVIGSEDTTLKIDSTLNIENKLDKSIRKKWLKFSRHSSDAQSVLESISSPRLQNKMNASKFVEKIIKTPTDLYKLQKPSIAPSSLSIQKNSAKKSTKKSPLKSAKKSIITSSKKSAIKRTVMPNFALIHQKAYEKMENLAEYSDRKKQRAEMLLSSNKSNSKRKSSVKQEETKAKSSRQLFSIETKNNKSDVKFNRFGFKIGELISKPSPLPVVKPISKPSPLPVVKPISKPSQVPVVQPIKTVAIIKPSLFTRTEVVALANKNKVVSNNREKRKDLLKGVRTNRRFDLLMQMRNNNK